MTLVKVNQKSHYVNDLKATDPKTKTHSPQANNTNLRQRNKDKRSIPQKKHANNKDLQRTSKHFSNNTVSRDKQSKIISTQLCGWINCKRANQTASISTSRTGHRESQQQKQPTVHRDKCFYSQAYANNNNNTETDAKTFAMQT